MVRTPDITEYLNVALKGMSLRQSAIANNIANLSTPGYRRHTVAFEKQLAEAIASGKLDDLKNLEMEVTQPRNTPLGENGNDVDLDTEIGELIRNTGIYKTYLRLLSKLYRQMAAAIESK